MNAMPCRFPAILAMAVLTLLSLNSCGKDDTEDIVVLFEDNFAGSYPAPSWAVDSGAPAQDGSVGSGFPPSLSLSSATGDATTAIPILVNAGGITFIVDVGAPSFTTQAGTANIIITDDDVPAVVASVAINLFAGTITYTTGATPEIDLVPGDAPFHRYAFIVAANGDTKWVRDGVITQSLPAAFTATNLTLTLSATGAGTVVYKADNVLVTRP